MSVDLDFTEACFLACIFQATISTSEEGTHNVTVGESFMLYCDAVNAASVVWEDGDGNIVLTGTNLTIDPVFVANESIYVCRVETPDCTGQLDYYLNVLGIAIGRIIYCTVMF